LSLNYIRGRLNGWIFLFSRAPTGKPIGSDFV
jgi:hypothetical protein